MGRRERVGACVEWSRVVNTTAAALAAVLAAAMSTAAPRDSLRVRGADGAWRVWWHAESAPRRWAAAYAPLERHVVWRAVAPGVELGELALSGNGEAWRVRAVLVRLDPAHQRLSLDALVDDDGRVKPWAVAHASPDVDVAFNAGMFDDVGPWGWVVHNGRELQRPGSGTLASTLVVDHEGRVRVVGADSMTALRAAAQRGEVAEAVQGYPTLLDDDGHVPSALWKGADGGVDLAHRDARLLVGELRDGRVLVVLTRFDGLRSLTGDLFGAVPLGMTVPEVAALAGALGCRRAMLLDGGLSAQLLVRDTERRERVWSGLRRVPLGFVSRRRDEMIARER